MKNLLLILGFSAGLLAAQASNVTSSSSTTQSVTVPGTAYDFSFQVSWWSDDFPMFSAPGQLDLLDSSGTLVGRVVATDFDGDVSITVGGNGTVDNVQANIGRFAGGTPADGTLAGVWHVTGLAPGNYTLRLWHYRSWDTTYSATTVWTATTLVSGSAPVPTNSSPTVTLLSPGDQTVTAGTTLTITSHATDPDGNITSHNLDIQRPAGDWNWQGGFATGEPFQGGPVGSGGDSTRSAAFTFTDVGTYYVRSAADDGGGWVQSATVAITVVPAAPTQYALATSASAGGTVTPGGTYDAGTVVYISATPDGTHDFAGWTGDAGGGATPVGVLMDRAKTVQASFALKSFTLTTSAMSGGSATPGGSYPYGTTVTLLAAPDSTHYFTGWTGDAAGAAPSVAVLVDRAKFVQAQFAPKTAQNITFGSPGNQVVGAAIALAANASSGLPVSFVLVSGPASLFGNTLTVTGPGAISVQALQPGDPYTLAATPVTVSFNASAAGRVRYQTAARTLLSAGQDASVANYVLGNP